MVTTHLPTVQLGRSDMRITRVGLGSFALGGSGWFASWGPQDDQDSIAAIRHGAELGINWIDTAAVYGLGHSEEVVARALKEMPRNERPYVFTKCGYLMVQENGTTRQRRMSTPESIRREIEGSLKRLGVERIDLYQVHWPPEDNTPTELYWQTLLDLKKAGKVRAVGLSNHSVAQLEAAEGVGHVDSLQPPFSAIRRDTATDILPWCAEHQTSVIVYAPMQKGLLTGAFDPERVKSLPAEDNRTRDRNFQGEPLARNLALAEALKPIAQRHSVTVSAVAVAWTLAWRGVTGAIVGVRRPEQVDDWVSAATLKLDERDLDEVAAAIEQTSAGSGPTRP